MNLAAGIACNGSFKGSIHRGKEKDCPSLSSPSEQYRKEVYHILKDEEKSPLPFL